MFKDKTKSGHEVKIYEIFVDRIHGAVKINGAWRCCVWSSDGKECKIVPVIGLHTYGGDTSPDLSLVELWPYDDFKVDDPVMVRQDSIDQTWRKRYFAGVTEDGKPLAFAHGSNKWSSNGETSQWHECRHPTEQELK